MVDVPGNTRPANDLPAGFKVTELGPLPEEWQVVRLGELGEISAGGSAPQGDHYFGGQNLFIRVQHLDEDGYWVRRWDFITNEAVQAYRFRLFPKGTIIFPKSGASIRLEKRAVLPFDAYIVSHLCAVMPDSNLVDQAYLFYALKFRKLSSEKAEGYPTLNLSEIRDTFIPLPPLPEQRAIAHVLRTAQEAKEATGRVIAALKELKKSLMRHLFTYGPVPVGAQRAAPLRETEIGPVPAHWQVVRLGEVAEKTHQFDPRRRPDWHFKYVDVSAISNERLQIENYAEYLGIDAPHRARKLVKSNDVIFATVRSYLKRAALVPRTLDGQIVSTAFCVIRCKPDVADPKFVFHAVSTDDFVERVSASQRGSSYPAVTDKDVLQQYIPLPPLPEQQEIARILHAVDGKIATEEKRREALTALFKSLLAELMSGRRRVKFTAEDTESAENPIKISQRTPRSLR